MPVPSFLTDSDELSRRVWEYFVAIMKSDKVAGGEDLPLWEDMDDEFKRCLTEAFSINVTREVEALFLPVVAPDPTPQDRPAKQVSCYICGRRPVYDAGTACLECWDMYLI